MSEVRQTEILEAILVLLGTIEDLLDDIKTNTAPE
jgi:hypothetical protein